MKLSEAITLVGTCPDMCPEFERVRRIVEKDVWYEERDERLEDSGTRSSRKADEIRMVKRFARSAAGQEEQLPSDLRPPEVLSGTLNYLLDFVTGRAETLGQVHHFVWDRTRAIRNDFSIQQVSRPNDVRHAIRCYEIIARFHIVALHQLAQRERPYDEYDPQQEREQLDKTMLSLVELYEDHKDKYRSENEAEFRAYQIIFQIHKPSPNLEDRIQCWDEYIAEDSQVQQALKIYRAACNYYEGQGPLGSRKSHRVAQSNWMSFWDILESEETSYLMACIAEIYFPLMRRNALRSIWKAFKPKANTESMEWSLEDMQDVFGMEDVEEVEKYVSKFGFQIKEGEDGLQRVDLGSVYGNFPDPHVGQSCTSMVEDKRKGLTMPALAKNITREEAMERSLVEEDEDDDRGNEEESDEDEDEVASQYTGNGETEQSLFVPEGARSAAVLPNPFAAASGSQQASSNLFGIGNNTGSLFQGRTPLQGFSAGSSAFPSTSPSPGQPQPSLFPSTSNGGDNPFGNQYQRQQAVAEKASSTPGQAVNDSPTDAAAEAKARATQDQVEAKRAADALAAEERGKQRIASLEAERAAKERAAREIAERRRLASQKAEEERRQAEEQRRKAIAAQEAELKEKEKAKTYVFEEVARRMLLDPGGLLDQFVEYKAGPMVQALRQQVEDDRLAQEADRFRLDKLQRRFGGRWKEICRRRNLARAGRERRERRRRGQEEREKRSADSNVATELDVFRRSQQNLRDSLAASRTSSTHPSPPHLARHSSRRTLNHSLAAKPPQPTPSPQRLSSSRSRNVNSAMAANHSQPKASSASPPTYDKYKVTNGVLSRADPSPPGSSVSVSSHVPFDGLSYTDWIAQRRAAKTQSSLRDTTSSPYFRMKAMGLNPTPNSLSPYASAHSPSPSLKRSRASDSFNNSTADALGASSPVQDIISKPWNVMPPPPPRKTARLSPPSPGANANHLVTSTGRTTPAQTLAGEADDFLQQIHEVANVLREGEEWYRTERQDDEQRRSVRASRRASLASQNSASSEAGQQQWAGHPAETANRRLSASLRQGASWESYAPPPRGASSGHDPAPPPFAPLKYRMRQSKFLPRDQYADARAERGEPMYIGSAKETVQEVSPQPVHSQEPGAATGVFEQTRTSATSSSPEDAVVANGAQLDARTATSTAYRASSTETPSLSSQQATAETTSNIAPKPPTTIKPSTASALTNGFAESLHAHSSSFLGQTKNPNANNIFGSSSTFSGFGTNDTTTPMAASTPSFTAANASASKLSPNECQHESRATPQEKVSQPTFGQKSGASLPHADSHSSFVPHPPETQTETESGAPFATQSAHQNPFSQDSQLATNNASGESTVSIAPGSAKKNPFSFSDTSTQSQTSKPVSVESKKRKLSSSELNQSRKHKEPNKSQDNPFQTSQSSFGRNSNSFAALADLSNDADDAVDGEGDEQLVAESQQMAQGNPPLDHEDDEQRSELEDETSGGFTSSSEDDSEDDDEDDSDAEDGSDEGKLVNGKSGASLEDAIEL